MRSCRIWNGQWAIWDTKKSGQARPSQVKPIPNHSITLEKHYLEIASNWTQRRYIYVDISAIRLTMNKYTQKPWCPMAVTYLDLIQPKSTDNSYHMTMWRTWCRVTKQTATMYTYMCICIHATMNVGKIS